MIITKEMKKEFDKLRPHDQWAWLFRYIDDIVIQVDNDETYISVLNDNDEESCSLRLKKDIGNREGVIELLKYLNFMVIKV